MFYRITRRAHGAPTWRGVRPWVECHERRLRMASSRLDVTRALSYCGRQARVATRERDRRNQVTDRRVPRNGCDFHKEGGPFMSEQVFTNATIAGPVSVYVKDGRIVRIRALQVDEKDLRPWTIKDPHGTNYSPPRELKVGPYVMAARTQIYASGQKPRQLGELVLGH